MNQPDAADRDSKRLNVVFCWTNISGYMAACWRALAADPAISLHVIAYEASSESRFDSELMQGLSWSPIPNSKLHSYAFVKELAESRAPDVVVVSGWLNSAYRKLAGDLRRQGIPCVMTMDTPWWGTLRQQAARFLLRSYVSSMSAVVVPGERAWQYATRLGASSERIFTGLYGVDRARLDQAMVERQELGNWPKRFLFLGRYHADKGLDVLLNAYKLYRDRVSAPWPLDCAGQGPLKSLLANIDGVTDLGFVQPSEMSGVLAKSGVLVLPSRFDPWPLALIEGASAGLPLIATRECGSTVEALRHQYNGWLTQPKIDNLCETMIEAHQSYELLEQMGLRGQELTQPYSQSEWAQRWKPILKKSACTATVRA